jgi:hypothetical protein
MLLWRTDRLVSLPQPLSCHFTVRVPDVVVRSAVWPALVPRLIYRLEKVCRMRAP